MANISAFSLWTLSSVNQVVNIATKEKGPKVDLAICTSGKCMMQCTLGGGPQTFATCLTDFRLTD